MPKMLECTVKAYDSQSAQDAFSVLFCNGLARGDGLIEIPAASLQMVISALEYIRYDCCGKDYDTIKQAIEIVENLRDVQKMREWKRQ